MKKISLIVATILLTSVAFAQNIEYGAKAGLNLATQTTEDGSTPARLSGYAGLFAEFGISNRLGIQPELIFSMQGAGDATDSNSPDKFNYINVPVMLKIYVLERSLSIDVGPQFGYLVSAKTGSLDIYDRIDNKFDVAIGLGASYKFGGRFDISVRHNVGLIKIMDSFDHTNAVTQMGLGIRF